MNTCLCRATNIDHGVEGGGNSSRSLRGWRKLRGRAVWDFMGESQDRKLQSVEFIETLAKNYGKTGCRMSLKVYILDAHPDKFKENVGAYSEEQGARFHQDICWTLNAATKDRIMKTRWDYIRGPICESDFKYYRKYKKLLTFFCVWSLLDGTRINKCYF